MGKLSRRNFIKNTAIGVSALGAGSTAFSMLLSCASDKIGGRLINRMMNVGIDFKPSPDVKPVEPVKSNILSKLSIATNSHAVVNKGKINPIITRSMLDQGIRELTGYQNLEEAWLSFFPSLNSDHIISIKINCDNYFLPSHQEIVQAITDGLIEIGIKPNNIIVWDNLEKDILNRGLRSSGYRINNSKNGVRYIATNTDGFGYDEGSIVKVNCLSCHGSQRNKSSVKILSEDLIMPVSKILTMSDHIINVPVLKNAGDASRFGVTGCMKNFYGAIPLGDTVSATNIRKMHRHSGNPQIPELYSNPIIKDKVRLNILDGLLGIYSGGPSGHPQWINNQLIISTDPVAVDYQEMLIIENKRLEKGLPSILRNAKYIQTAAEMNLGTNNPKQMEVLEVKLA